MPVRSFGSRVLKWPDARAVDQALREWVGRTVPLHPEVVRIGYFGSYARGDWGVGSDLDLVIVVERADEPFIRRPARWDLTKLLVPAEALVYTIEEWGSLPESGPFGQSLRRETVWVYEKTDFSR